MKQLQQEVLRSVAGKTLSKESASLVLRAAARLQAAEGPIAVVGMAGRWPGADDIDALWRVLRAGEFQVRPFPEARRRAMAPWMGDDATAPLLPGAWLDDVDGFDADFFGLASRDVELMDPAQRLFLESAWMALRDAVGDPATLRGRAVGVFAGSCPGSDDPTYWELLRHHAPQLASVAFTGNLPSMLPGRVSHLLDLRGPSIAVDTACSSSLVAVHAACQALRHGECEMALAGGVKLNLFPRTPADTIGIESPDGLTRTFAGGPGGTGVGEGVGVVVLKPLSAALAQGDRVYAIVAGSACNQDGRTAGLTVPSVTAQQGVIEAAWRAARVGAADIGCVEAHGTGTRLGDPIEFEALARAFRAVEAGGARCALGSSKTVFGHLDSAAGITGFIKGVLAVHHAHLPASLNFVAPNEHIDYFGSALHVNDRDRPWPADAGRNCGVSAFSMAGANCHVVIGPAPAHERADRPLVDATQSRRRHWFAETPLPTRSRPAGALAAPPKDADTLTQIWTELLGASAAREDADFFQAGGDSLKAAVLASRLARELQRPVGVSQLWRTPTLGGLRGFLRDTQPGNGSDMQAALPAFPPRERYALTPPQKHMMLHGMLQSDTLYNVPFGLRLSGRVDADKLRRRALAVAAADAGLRVRFAMHGGRPAMQRTDALALEFDVVAAADDAGVDRATAAFIRPFDLRSGPFARLRLVQRAGGDAVLLMDFHHLVMDGVSVAVFVQRLAQACAAADDAAAATAALPARTGLDHAAWFEERAARGEFARHAPFWSSRFSQRSAGAVAALRSPVQGETIGARHTITLDAAASRTATDFARASGLGLFATVLGAYALAVHALSGQRAFNIGTPFSGRLHAGTEDVLGMFVNLLPMAIDISPDATPADWLAALRGGLADAMEVQDGPLDLAAPEPGALRDALGFNVAFALQNMPLGAFELDAGVLATPLPFYDLPWNVAKFDLTLFAMETDGHLVLSFERRAGAMTSTTLERLADAVVALLAGIASGRLPRLRDALALPGAVFAHASPLAPSPSPATAATAATTPTLHF